MTRGRLHPLGRHRPRQPLANPTHLYAVLTPNSVRPQRRARGPQL